LKPCQAASVLKKDKKDPLRLMRGGTIKGQIDQNSGICKVSSRETVRKWQRRLRRAPFACGGRCFTNSQGVPDFDVSLQIGFQASGVMRNNLIALCAIPALIYIVVKSSS